MKLRKLSTAAALSTLLVSGAASAGTLVTSWEYVTDLNFTAASFGGALGGDTSASDDELSWGYEFGDFENPTSSAALNRSALTIGGNLLDSGDETGGGEVTGIVLTNTDGILDIGEVGLGNSMTHWNNTISSSFATLKSGSLLDELTLSPFTPVDSPAQVEAPDIVFDFRFLETPNGGDDSGNCEDGDPRPSAGCEDIFGVFGVQSTDLVFTYDGYKYAASVLVIDPLDPENSEPLQTLADGECIALGFDVGCEGFITPENEHTSIQFGFTVDSLGPIVPVPAAAWLFGTALLGFAGYSRRKNKS